MRGPAWVRLGEEGRPGRREGRCQRCPAGSPRTLPRSDGRAGLGGPRGTPARPLEGQGGRGPPGWGSRKAKGKSAPPGTKSGPWGSGAALDRELRARAWRSLGGGKQRLSPAPSCARGAGLGLCRKKMTRQGFQNWTPVQEKGAFWKRARNWVCLGWGE